MKEKLIKLIDLKTMVTLLMAISLVVGFFKGMITSEVFIPFVSMTFMFYFQKKKEGEN